MTEDVTRPETATRCTWKPLLALAALVVALLALPSGPAWAATFTVNRTGDAEDRKLNDAQCDTSKNKNKQCTLRAAIEEANDTSGVDAIKFNIDGGGVKTISPSSPLPDITDPVTIDGYSQKGAKENALEEGTDAVLKVELDGTNAGSLVDGLRIRTADSTVKGLVINRFGNNGISILGAGNDGNRVEGNFIGTTADGGGDLGNLVGVVISSRENTVGGTEPAAANIISGNDFDGVKIVDGTGNSVLSNSIFDNDGFGIALAAGGVSPNDPDDPDTGANNLQNFPDVTSAAKSSATGFTTITGTLNSNPSESFLIQCFLTESQPDGSGHGEGEVLLDTTTRSTNPSGDATFQCDSRVPGLGQEVTATATNVATGDTSEFSDNAEVIGTVSLP